MTLLVTLLLVYHVAERICTRSFADRAQRDDECCGGAVEISAPRGLEEQRHGDGARVEHAHGHVTHVAGVSPPSAQLFGVLRAGAGRSGAAARSASRSRPVMASAAGSMASTIVLSPTCACLRPCTVATPAATPAARAAASALWAVALDSSRNHIPNSGPDVPPVSRKPHSPARTPRLPSRSDRRRAGESLGAAPRRGWCRNHRHPHGGPLTTPAPGYARGHPTAVTARHRFG